MPSQEVTVQARSSIRKLAISRRARAPGNSCVVNGGSCGGRGRSVYGLGLAGLIKIAQEKIGSYIHTSTAGRFPMVEKVFVSYNKVHKLCQESAQKLIQFDPEVIIAIGGGGFIPARILRTFLKKARGGRSKNIPIQAIGLSLYEDMGTDDYEEKIGKEVIRMQWLDFSSLQEHKVDLLGKNILIVDEVDDTRTTLHYAVSELQKDLDKLATELGRSNEKTTISVFVLHNKEKPKNADLPQELMDSGRYVAAATVRDEWIAYPWEADDIVEHTRLAVEQGHD